MKTILLMTHRESSVFRAIAETISACSRKRGWALHVITAADADEAGRIAKAWNADGCLIYAARPHGLEYRKKSRSMPVVLISPSETCKDICFTAHDSYVTGRIAAHGLADLGLDSFAFAAETPRLPWADKRLETFRETLHGYGREVEVFPGGNLTEWLKSLPDRCGLFAANDRMAEKIVAAAKSAKIAIPDNLVVLGCDDDVQICEHAEISISSIRPDYAQGGTFAFDMLTALMNGERTEISRLFGDSGIVHRASTRVFSKPSQEISKALEYIRINALSGISATDVIKEIKGSRRTVENLFRAATGHSILEEIQSVRLNEAKRLLANPHIKIGAIAARTGYRSENFLTRLFKRETGMTPSQWRASRT